MQRVKSTLAATALALGLSITSLAAGTGEDGYFTLYNDSENNVLTGFYIGDGNNWSQNWLDGVEILPGKSAEASFDNAGNCDLFFVAGWKGTNGEVEDEPFSIDVCDASNVYLGDNDISYD